MRRLEATILTTHVDLHGDRFAPEGLGSFVDSINSNYLPFTVEHDVRNVPIGRVASATIVPLEDGEFAVRATIEIFEQGDNISSLYGDGRRINMSRDNAPTFSVEYDRSFGTIEGRELLAALSRLSPESQAKAQIKKSVDPISTLIIAAAIAAGASIATGFLGKLGEDLYDGLKSVLKSYFGARKELSECLLGFRFTMSNHGELVEIHVLLTNPTPEDVEALFACGFNLLDSYISECEGMDSVARYVFEYKNGRLEFLYALRTDCIPLRLR